MTRTRPTGPTAVVTKRKSPTTRPTARVRAFALAVTAVTTPAADNVTATASGVDAPKPEALDRTHLNPHGQKVFGRIVADQLVRTQVELGPDVVGEPAKPAAK